MRSSHDTAIPDSSRCSRARRRRRSTGSRSSASSSRARTAVTASPAAEARAASGCSRSATARGTRSRRRFGRRTRPAPEPSSLTTLSLRWSRAPPAGERRSRRRRASSRSTSAPSCSRPAGAATRRPRRAANSPRTIPMRPARRLASPSRPARRRGTSMRSSTTRTGAWPATMQGYSIPETTRAYGAVLLNVDGEEFTDSLGPRDAVSQAIFDEVEKGKGVLTPDGRPAVWLDTTRIAPDDAEISLPYMLRRYRGADIDPLAEPIYTYPVLHYQNGGLVIDEHAETTLEGVYACGEIAGGTHGRNRMMGNSLLECTVFGRRAGQAARRRRVHDHSRDGPVECCRRRCCTPLRLGPEGHSTRPSRRARRCRCARDLGDGTARPPDDPPQRERRRGREEPRLPGHGDRGLLLPRRRALPLHPAHLRRAQGGHRARDRRASAALEHGHTLTRENTGPNVGFGSRSSTGTSSPTGTGST